MEDVIGRVRSTAEVDDDMDWMDPGRNFWGTLRRDGETMTVATTMTTTTNGGGTGGRANSDDEDFWETGDLRRMNGGTGGDQ